MKKTKTNQSKTEELYELVTSFSDAEVAEFEQHAKRKRSQTEYWRLFDHMRKIHVEGGLAVEQIREPEIKASVVGTGEEWGSYRSLTRNLYRNLLDFLAERYRNQAEIQWREKVMRGLDEVEVLADRKFYKQAAARLIQVEQWVPAQTSGLPWKDLSPILRLGALKIWLNALVDFLQVVADDEARANLYSIAHIFRHPSSPMTQKNLFVHLNLSGEKMLMFRIVAQMLEVEKNDRQQLRLLDGALKELQSPTGFEKLLKRYAGSFPDGPLKSRLLAAFTMRLSLRKVGLLIDKGELHEALNEMDRFRKNTEHDLSIAMLMLLSTQIQEIGLAQAISKSKDAHGYNLEAEYAYTEQLIQDLPTRIEINAALVHAYHGDYAEALARTEKLMKTRLGPNARKAFVVELKVLECVLRIELAPSETFDYECIRRLDRAIHNHQGEAFEKAALQVIEGVGQWAGDRSQQTYWLKDHGAEVAALRQATNRSNPLHQFLLYWTKRVRDQDNVARW